jgi:WD40-like Beta Propeller Repeat
MSEYPPIKPSERSGRPPVRSLGLLLGLACLFGSSACGSAVPTGSSAVSPATESTPTPAATEAAQAADIDGLVVLTGGAMGIGTADGVIVGLAGPGGPVGGLSAANGRLVVGAAGPAFANADITQAGAAMTWQPIELAATEVRLALSAPALSPDGSHLAFTASEPGTTDAFQVFTLDLAKGDRRSQSFDRESNGPPVWIDGTSLLVEVVPIPGGTRFLRLDTASSSVEPVRADGFGPAISGDGSVLAVASTDGSVVAVPTADWLAGNPPDEGAIVDASGHPYALAVDRTGRRIAIGYADDGGDPASIAVLVREGGGWRRSATPVKVAPGTPTMLGWLN